MSQDKFSAVWVSHSSISDYLKCPRCYYLKNVYKDPKTGHKINIMNPSMALGQAVHEVVEALSILPTGERFNESLVDKFERVWAKYKGKQGGFWDQKTEDNFKQRGINMVKRVQSNPGPLKNRAVKINMDLPNFWLSEEDGIILCGKIDWLEYLEEIDSVHVIDFKTSKSEEDSESLQLPIYHLLVKFCQKRDVVKASYWYLDYSDALTPKELPDIDESMEKVLQVARRIKLARKLEKYDCGKGPESCHFCRDYEKILRGEAEFIGVNDFKNDVYILKVDSQLDQDDSYIL